MADTTSNQYRGRLYHIRGEMNLSSPCKQIFFKGLQLSQIWATFNKNFSPAKISNPFSKTWRQWSFLMKQLLKNKTKLGIITCFSLSRSQKSCSVVLRNGWTSSAWFIYFGKNSWGKLSAWEVSAQMVSVSQSLAYLMQVEMFLYWQVKGKLMYQQCSLLRIEKDYIYINCFFLMFQVLWVYIALQRCGDVSDWTGYKALLEDCSDRAMGSIWYSCQFNLWRSVLHWGTWRWSFGTGMVWQKTSQEMYVHAFVLF